MKTTKLPSVEDTVDDFFDNTFKWVDMENGLGQYLLMTDVEKHLKAKITEDRNQAYTSLVELITEHAQSPKSFNPLDLLEDIDKLYGVKENVVKPLYGKK